MGLKYLTTTLAAEAAKKPSHPENIWVVAGIILVVGIIGIVVWNRKRNRRG